MKKKEQKILVLVVLTVFAANIGAQFAGGSGTEANPWQIETAEHLNNVRNYLGEEHSDKYFIQTTDINLYDATRQGGAYWNEGEGWLPLGSSDSRFTGSYDGDGKTISGMFIDRPEVNYQGLFGYTEGAVITGLTVSNVEITGGEMVGALAGMLLGTTVTDCHSCGSISGLHFTGGLAGRSSEGSEVFDCSSDADITMYEPPPPPPEWMVFVQGTEGVDFGSPIGAGYFTPATNYHVSLSSFYISRYEVTQSEWTEVMGGIYDPNWNYGQGPNHPAYRISWFDAIEYCNRLSIREGLTPAYSYGGAGTNPANWPAGWNTAWQNHTNVSCNWNANGYRLPTEMELEFAARGGVLAADNNTFNHTYAGTDDEAELGYYAWYWDNSDTGQGRQSHPVGTKLPNELGLYDMSGNVRNWVWDIRSNYYPQGRHNNPTGPTTGSRRVFRGGGWNDSAGYCNVSYRYCYYPSYRYPVLGFRVCRVVP